MANEVLLQNEDRNTNYFTEQSRIDSKAALNLPQDHPGFVSLTNTPWTSYETCKGSCGRLVCKHVPGPEEQKYQVQQKTGSTEPSLEQMERYQIVPGMIVPGVGLVCSTACLYRKDPQHPAVSSIDPNSIKLDLRNLELTELRNRLDDMVLSHVKEQESWATNELTTEQLEEELQRRKSG